ncbi:4-hydroxythreonine-4-phosphate dehydrogenase PdxA [Brasilonema octagenarum UFV-E1]|uniref:4-hydroxythreonine-4-phosphate dehydrogenase n=1 Tax=Brasilonema sennae CENA114 TaxID=415709 RepID=A0A856MM05_9CYAN|nr:4-hydroxythreonine-4-phosphate dehydrogenase PdxA [Brasilonema sennae]QDL12463.1 4-hydroxythreonine-4-phosphate dehydrogenase PdxA [Brasilonema sennae CENA114]QDL18853.1 4-hydroxythreonine-4-phosphate dehydrogenase PdxA [Brasilonema octagenarum UFV-E1]
MYKLDEKDITPVQSRPRLALTLGDPAGIGPEVILKALADPEVSKSCDLTVVGSRSLLVEIYTKLKLAKNSQPLANPEELSIFDVPLDKHIQDEILIGTGNAASGAASFAYMETAIAQTLADQFDGIVTGPIAKSAWKAAGYNYPGQTELLAEKSGAKRVGMLFVARSPHTNWTLCTLLACTHVPLSQVPKVLTPQLMTEKLDLLVECLEKDFGLERARIAIAGLNPHSGEQGQLGHEEQDWLIPWISQERKNRPNFQLDGPVPPDTMWVKPGQAWYGNIDPSAPLRVNPSQVADAYIALYHDQGLIPVKLMAFDRAVNTSIGLPFIRTSPDHGTAFDIAGKGIADARSMKAAILLAAELVSQRRKVKL